MGGGGLEREGWGGKMKKERGGVGRWGRSEQVWVGRRGVGWEDGEGVGRCGWEGEGWGGKEDTNNEDLVY